MEKYNIWINAGIGLMVLLDWVFCFILARNIALKKGHSAQKSLFFAIMGPISLFRFMMEGISSADIKLPIIKPKIQPTARPSDSAASSSITYDDYRAHYRFNEILPLVAHDEGTALRLINLERNQNPGSNLDRWMDLAIFRLVHDRGANHFQYASEEYE